MPMTGSGSFLGKIHPRVVPLFTIVMICGIFSKEAVGISWPNVFWGDV